MNNGEGRLTEAGSIAIYGAVSGFSDMRCRSARVGVPGPLCAFSLTRKQNDRVSAALGRP